MRIPQIYSAHQWLIWVSAMIMLLCGMGIIRLLIVIMRPGNKTLEVASRLAMEFALITAILYTLIVRVNTL